jgi:abhydrolase domain-containing protein 12
LFFFFSVHWPKHIDFDKPENEGLEGARNFYIQTDLKVEVGVWQILPQDLINQSKNKSKAWFEQALSNGQPIVLYLHGNTGSRAREHRIELYKVLQKLNYHIICFDYRGKNTTSKVHL